MDFAWEILEKDTIKRKEDFKCSVKQRKHKMQMK